MAMEAVELQGLTRTVNEILILGSLRSGARHGYQIALEVEEKSSGYFRFNHGTLYPILHHLEKRGYIDGDWEEGSGPRRRKAYRLTREGERYLDERSTGWRELDARLSDFLTAVPVVRGGIASRERRSGSA